MASISGEQGAVKPRPISALPSVQARVLAFAAILVAGVSGLLIGYSAVRVGCHGKCGTPEGIGAVTGALFATVGVSVIAVLVLRAMGEWRSIKDKRQLDLVIAAARAAVQSGTRPPAVPLDDGAVEGGGVAPDPPPGVAPDPPPPVAEPPPI